jgi:hypothetical protein
MSIKYKKLWIIVWSMWSDVHRTYVWIIIQIGERWRSLYSGDTVRTVSLVINLDQNSHVYSVYITPQLHTLVFVCMCVCVFNDGLSDVYVLYYQMKYGCK